MSSCTSCNLCENPRTLDEAVEKGQVPCDVRHFAGNLFTIWRCVNCNSLHSAEDVDLADYYAHYPLQNQRLDFPTRISYRDRLRLLAKQAVRRSDRILDYGCGTGAFVAFLREKGYRYADGFDPFITAYADRKVLRVKYDAVVSYEVMEHVDDPKQFLSELSDLTCPRGLIVIGTPNADYLSVTKKAPHDIELSQPYHRHILSERTLLYLGQERGLLPVHIYRRMPMDSLVPGVNTRFMWTYINLMGGMIDAAVEPPGIWVILRSPALLFYTFFGYFFPPRGNMLVSFRKT